MTPLTEYFLNREEEIRRRKHHLDIWDQQGKYQSVTFHTADSLPAEVRKEIEKIRLQFLDKYPLPWTESVTRRFRSIIGKRNDSLLDAGYGRCVFKESEIRKVLSDAIWYYAGERYEIVRYVIMPNHVHMLVRMLGEYDLEKTINSIRRFSATRINRMLGTDGEFWYGENYMRLIRSLKHFDTVKAYIADNPKYLKEGEYELW